MTTTHTLFFTAGRWEGEGTITFSMSEDELPFRAVWTVHPLTDNAISFVQTIDVLGGGEQMENRFTFKNITPTTFAVTLENDLLGRAEGKGVIDGATIAWEFHGDVAPFEGLEIYERQENNLYQLKSEFSSQDELRTYIKGSLSKVS